MSPQEIEKLLGGYATDTLTGEERHALFAAALGNQALFDALADEQALRELLQDPASRAHLLGALREERVSPMAWVVSWVRRPSVVALAGAVAAGIVVIAVIGPGTLKRVPAPAEVAMSRAQEPAPRPEPEAKPMGLASSPAKQAQAEAPGKMRKPELERKDLERDMPVAQNAMARPAAAPAPPSSLPLPVRVSPPPPAAPPPQAAVSETSQVAQSKLADALQSASADYRTEFRKESAAVNARDLYYAPLQPVVSGFLNAPKEKAAKRQSAPGAFSGGAGRVAGGAVARFLGVRYSILKRNADGSFAEVDPTGLLAPGDALRVRFEANQQGSLAVMERQSSGMWTLRMAARTLAGEPVQMPAESTIDIASHGELRFFVRFAKTMQPQPRMSQVTATPGLLRDKVGNAVYVVNPARAVDAAVGFELTIVAK